MTTGPLTILYRVLEALSLLLIVAAVLLGTALGGATQAHETLMVGALILAAAAAGALARALLPPPARLPAAGDLSVYHPKQFRKRMGLLALLLLGFVWLQAMPLPEWGQRILAPRSHRVTTELTSGLEAVADWSEDTEHRVHRSISLAPNATREAGVVMLLGIVLFFTILVVVHRRSQLYLILGGLLLAGVAQAALGFYQAFVSGGEIQGTYPNRNYFAGVIEMTASLAFVLTLNRRIDVRTDMTAKERFAANVSATAKTTWKVALIAIFCTLVGIVFLSRSRMGIVSMGMGILGLVFYLAHGRWSRVQGKLFWGALAGVLILLAASFLLRDHPTMHRFSLLISGNDVGANSRVTVWKDGLQMFLEAPLLGAGLGAFGETYLLYQSPDQLVPHFDHAHNDWLNLLTDLGIFGFAIIAYGLYLCVRKLFFQHERLRTYQRGILAGVFAGVVAILVHSLADFNLQVPANAFLFSALLASGLAGTDLIEAKQVRHRRRK